MLQKTKNQTFLAMFLFNLLTFFSSRNDSNTSAGRRRGRTTTTLGDQRYEWKSHPCHSQRSRKTAGLNKIRKVSFLTFLAGF